MNYRRSNMPRRTVRRNPSARRLAVEQMEPRLLLSVVYQGNLELKPLNSIGAGYIENLQSWAASCYLCSESVSDYVHLDSAGGVTAIAIGNQNSSVTLSDSGPDYFRVTDADLPLDAGREAMIDLAMTDRTRGLSSHGDPDAGQSWTSELVGAERSVSGQAESAAARMTVDGARGRGRLFDLAMATGWESGPSKTDTPIGVPIGPSAAIREGFLFEPAESPDPAARTSLSASLVEPDASANVSQGALSRADDRALPSSELQPQSPRLQSVWPVSTASEPGFVAPQPELAEADRHEAAFAELGEDVELAWLPPVYLDEKRRVDVAAVLVAVAIVGRTALPQDRQLTPTGTYLVPPRRRSRWRKPTSHVPVLAERARRVAS